MGETNLTLYDYSLRRAQVAGQAARSALSGLITQQAPDTPKWFFTGNDFHWRAIGSPNAPVATMQHIGPQQQNTATIPTQLTQPNAERQGEQ